jgi:hypothetical protein
MAEGKVTLATLVLGKSYKHLWDGAYIEFKRNVPVEVDEDLADELEGLTDTKGIENSTEVIELDRFKIERDQRPLEVVQSEKTRRRLRLVSEEVSAAKPRKPPVLKAPPKGFKRKAS